MFLLLPIVLYLTSQIINPFLQQFNYGELWEYGFLNIKKPIVMWKEFTHVVLSILISAFVGKLALHFLNNVSFFKKLLELSREKSRKVLILSLLLAIPLYFVFMIRYAYYPMTVELSLADCGPLELCAPAPRMLSIFGTTIYLATLLYISYILITIYRFFTNKK